MYANLIKRYNGEPRMFDAANKLSSITLNYEFKGGDCFSSEFIRINQHARK